MPSRRPAAPVITLTTDFGLADHYVGTMKGVIVGIAPAARVVDLSHEVSAYRVSSGGFVLAQAYRYFPPKTVHIAVVDPGVGTSRRPILMEAAGQYFVGPDNGIFSMVFSREPGHKVRAVTAEKYWLRPVSQTFHGRDIFAPTAAHLAAGVPPARFGKLIDDYLRPLSERPVRTARRGWTGAILHVDRFGNLITNFEFDEFPQIGAGRFEMQVGLQIVRQFVHNYAECPHGEPCLISGSSGYLEVSVNQGSAARQLGCGAGAPVELTIY
ncbi:MAG: S-adenosyl-l-methionine hydroxide adenosyltransferase family protein [Bryobacteraceae bacterium]